MSLHAYQTALGRVIRSPVANRGDEIAHLRVALNDDEHAYLLQLLNGRGLPFTIDVQRSWCKGRARDAAYFTLSRLSESMQQQLLTRWVERGGGTSSFFANEADSFLEFIAAQLEPCTHVMSICNMEHAAHRAARGNAETAAPIVPDILSPETMLAMSRYSRLVEFYCNPDQLFATLQGKAPLPDVEEQAVTLLFAPWIPNYFRYAQAAEIKLLTSLRQVTTVRGLISTGYDLPCIRDLLLVGAILALDG